MATGNKECAVISLGYLITPKRQLRPIRQVPELCVVYLVELQTTVNWVEEIIVETEGGGTEDCINV